MGMHDNNTDYGVDVRRSPDPDSSMDSTATSPDAMQKSPISGWIEMWDYVGGNRFRGFVAEKEDKKTMFVFFDPSVIGGDLKAGLVALLELCEVDYFSCDRLVVCIDRQADQLARDTLTKDLGWAGFNLTTLDDFSQGEELVSDKWLFMDMET